MTATSQDRSGAISASRQTLLSRPLGAGWCVAAWFASTLAFVSQTQLLGGVTTGDASDSVNTTWAFAHGVPACAYPPGNQFGLPYIPPVYPLVAAALAAIGRIGHSVAFPTRAMMGPHCSTAVDAMYHWWLRSGSLGPTVKLGYVGWPVLLVGTVALIRASGRGRTTGEASAVLLIALTPSVVMCLHEFFHPQDLLALGLILGGVAAALSNRWSLAGILLGLALSTQQFALLALVPLLIVVHRDRLVRLVGSALAVCALCVVPIVALDSSGAAKAAVLGSGTTWAAGTVLDATHLTGPILFLLARGLPLAVAAVLAWWAQDRLGAAVQETVPLLSLVATSLALRLVFEVNLWGYYFMAVSVALIALDVVRGRIRWSLVAWLVLPLLAFHPVVASPSSFGPQLTWWLPLWLWQLVLVTPAVALAVAPLVATVRRAERLSPTTAAS
jgi:hypothetical protein